MSTCAWGDCPNPSGYEVFIDDEPVKFCRDHAEKWGVEVSPDEADGTREDWERGARTAALDERNI